MSNFLRDLPKEKILVYVAIEVPDDYTEGTTDKTYLNPIPIEAVVTNLSESKTIWKTSGTVNDISWALLVDFRYKNLIDQSQKILVKNSYECYGVNSNSKIQYKEMAVDGDKCIEILTWRKQ